MNKICHYLDFNYKRGVYLNFTVTKERTHFLEQKSCGSYIFQSLNRRYKEHYSGSQILSNESSEASRYLQANVLGFSTLANNSSLYEFRNQTKETASTAVFSGIPMAAMPLIHQGTFEFQILYVFI